MAVPVSLFKEALEDLIRKRLRAGEYPVNILTDLNSVIPDVQGLTKYVGDYHEGHKEWNRPVTS